MFLNGSYLPILLKKKNFDRNYNMKFKKKKLIYSFTLEIGKIF